MPDLFLYILFLPVMLGILFLIIIIALIIVILRPQGKRWALDLIGEECIVVEDLSPTKMGWVRVRGELWRARSIRSDMKRGDRGVVIKVFRDYLLVDKEYVPVQKTPWWLHISQANRFSYTKF
ncbi:MAG: NfeD family protein [Candidatus Njordarchaeales archaeon]